MFDKRITERAGHNVSVLEKSRLIGNHTDAICHHVPHNNIFVVVLLAVSALARATL